MGPLFQFDQPQPAVWLFAALAVAVALFLQFTRPFALRNWDLLGLFLFAPGFLIVYSARQLPGDTYGQTMVGYGWLLVASAVWFGRCMFDGLIARRPRVSPNLTPPGLFWLGGALLLGLSLSTAARPIDPLAVVGTPPLAQSRVEDKAADVVTQAQPADTAVGVARQWVTRGLAIVCQVAVVVLLYLICRRHYSDATAGLTAAVLYLLLPATGYHFDQSHHVWPTALILGAVLAYRRPHVAGLLLGLASGTAFFPIVLAPAWIQFYHGRGSGRFAVWMLSAAAGSLLVSVLALGFAGSFSTGVFQTLNLVDWQPWRSSHVESIWMGSRWMYRLPVFIAYIAFGFATFIWPRVRDLGQLLAVSAAMLIGIQFWFADHGGLYVLWYAPLLLLVVLRPTTTDLIPPAVNGSHFFGWLRRKPVTSTVPTPGLAV